VLLTVTYGTASALFLALRVIKQLVHDDGDAVPILQDNIYVNDVLFDAEDVPLLLRSREHICSLLANGGFTLRKWASNHLELLNDIPSEDHGLAGDKRLQLDDRMPEHSWTILESRSRFISVLNVFGGISASYETHNTLGDREIIRSLRVTPITVTAKIFMQHLWHLKLTWNDVISPLMIN